MRLTSVFGVASVISTNYCQETFKCLIMLILVAFRHKEAAVLVDYS